MTDQAVENDQKPAETAAPAPAAPEEKSQREAMLEQLVAKRNEDFDADNKRAADEAGVQFQPQFVEPEGEPAPTPTPAPVDQLAAQLGDDGVIPEEALGKYKVRLKIDGQERLMTIAEIRTEAQIDGAARSRLQAAEQARREAEAAKVQAQAPAQPEQPTSEELTDDEIAPWREAAKGVYEGESEEEVAKRLARAARGAGRSQQAPTPAVNKSEIAAEVRQQIVIDGALAKFKQDYSEIVSDPDLARKADAFLNVELAKGVPFEQAIITAGNSTRDWVKTIAGAFVQPSPTTQANERLERKARIDNLPSASATTRSTEPLPQTASDIIAEMKRQRGQSL